MKVSFCPDIILGAVDRISSSMSDPTRPTVEVAHLRPVNQMTLSPSLRQHTQLTPALIQPALSGWGFDIMFNHPRKSYPNDNSSSYTAFSKHTQSEKNLKQELTASVLKKDPKHTRD